jgi:hypothetical protein
MLQWLNDMGLVMFSKFSLRIQNVLKNMSVRRPVDLFGSMVAQEMFGEVSDISDYNPYSKEYDSLFHAPWDILWDMFKPEGYKFVPEAVAVNIVK